MFDKYAKIAQYIDVVLNYLVILTEDAMTLQNGLKVVHKTHGVGEIIGTESMDFGGVSQEFYRLRILSTGMEVKFPVNSSAALIRSLATEAEIEIHEIYT